MWYWKELNNGIRLIVDPEKKHKPNWKTEHRNNNKKNSDRRRLLKKCGIVKRGIK